MKTSPLGEECVCVCVCEHERTTHTYIHTQAEVDNIIKQKF